MEESDVEQADPSPTGVYKSNHYTSLMHKATAIDTDSIVSEDSQTAKSLEAAAGQVSLPDGRLFHIELWLFRHLLKITILCQTLVLLGIRWANPNAFSVNRHQNSSVEAFCWIFEIALAVCNTLANINAARSILNTYLSISSFIQLYISTTIMFAGLYFACYLVDQHSFLLQMESNDHSPASIFLIFWYFSFATQSTSGFGDIVPRRFASQFFTSMQMLTSVLYSVAIFAVGTTHIRLQHEINANRHPRRIRSTLDFDTIAESITAQLARYAPFYAVWSGWIRRTPLLVTCMTFVMCLMTVIIFRVDYSDVIRPSFKLVITAFCILLLQCANFLVVITTSFVLVRKINAEDVTPEFLIQSYLSTALLFGGMYFTVYIIEGPSSFYLVSNDLKGIDIAQLIFYFGYFAISAQTGCGFGDIYPLATSTRVLVSFHLLVSMIYTAIILGLGLSNLVERILPGRLHTTPRVLSEVCPGPSS